MLVLVGLLFVVFLLYTMNATFLHWEMGATGVGSITGVKAIFSPLFVDSNCKSFPLEGLLLVWFSSLARKRLVSFGNRNIRVAIGMD